jgi:hypothetical protein
MYLALDIGSLEDALDLVESNSSGSAAINTARDAAVAAAAAAAAELDVLGRPAADTTQPAFFNTTNAGPCTATCPV